MRRTAIQDRGRQATAIRPPHLHRSLLMLIAILPFVVFSGLAAESPPSENQLRAAFILNFTRFITWPDDRFDEPDAPLVVGVLGDDRLASEMIKLFAGKTVASRNLQVKAANDLGLLGRCHAVYLGRIDERHVSEALEVLHSNRVVTLGEAKGFIDKGGALGFTWEGKKLRFEVNLDTASAAGVSISSQLLRLSQRVVQRNRNAKP